MGGFPHSLHQLNPLDVHLFLVMILPACGPHQLLCRVGIPSPSLAQGSGPGGLSLLFPAPITNSCFSGYFPRVSHTSPACWLFLGFKDLLIRQYGPQGLLSPKAWSEGERQVCTYKGLAQIEPWGWGGGFDHNPWHVRS